MKKILIIALSLLFTMPLAYSQQQESMERVHAVKVAYITDKLHFSSEQSARFWPVYNNYEQEAQSIRRSFFEKYRGDDPANTDDAAAYQFIDDNLEYQEQIIQLKRKYNDEFLRVVSPQQVAELYRSEREFKGMLLQQLKERHAGGGPVGGRRGR